MSISLSRAGQGPASGPAASGQGLFWDQTNSVTHLAPIGLFPLKQDGRVQCASRE